MNNLPMFESTKTLEFETDQSKRIAELEAELEQVKAKRDKILENATETIIGGITQEKVDAWLAKRDLEQQIKALEDLLNYAYFGNKPASFNCGNVVDVEDIKKRIKQLKQQAEGE